MPCTNDEAPFLSFALPAFFVSEIRALLRDKIRIPDEQAATVNNRRLLLYFALTYLISWLLWLPLLASSHNWFPAEAPFILYYLGAVGPALAAVILVWLDHGKEGVWSLLRHLVLWRASVKWYLVALLLPAVVRLTALSALYSFGYVTSDFSLRPWHELLWLFLLMLILVPLEEIGWRGYALPRLQIIYGALWASMRLGVVWSFWHLPLVWVSGSYQESRSPLAYMLVFTLTILPISILFTWLYNRTRGSLLLASLFHAVINVTESALVIREKDGLLLLLVSCALNSALAAVITARSARTLNV
jgi:CAAX protease family protein